MALTNRGSGGRGGNLSWEQVTDMLRGLVQELPLSVALLDETGTAVAVSRGFRELFGVPDEIELAGRSVLTDSSSRKQGTVALFERALAGEIVPFERVEFYSPYGAQTVTSGRIVPLVDAEGRVRYVCIYHEDVTDSALGEREANNRGLEALARVAGRIAHTFGNRLAELVGLISMARREVGEDTPVADILDEALVSCRRAAASAHELVTFAPGGAIVKEDVDLSRLLREVLESLPSHLFLEVNVPDGLWTCRCDPAQVAAALGAILDNAQECSRAGDVLSVSADNFVVPESGLDDLSPGRYVVVRVSDQGGGMSSHVLARAMDPYFTTKPGSAGLGLSMAASVAKAHGGKLTLDSQPGVGTRVTLYLPATEEIDAQDRTGARTMRRLRILVMDDEPMVRLVTTRMLTRLGCHVEAVADGRAAVDEYRRALDEGRPFDVLLLDLVVTEGMGGVEAMERIRILDPDAVGIAMSGYSVEAAPELVSTRGFVARLRKPFDMSKLEDVLQKAYLLRAQHFDGT